MGNESAVMEKQLVIFDLGGEVYGIDIAAVHEIIRMQLITKVPKSPFFVEGIINLRGKVIPVVDMRRRFGLPKIEQTTDSRIVVVESGGINTGIIVDAVTEVLRIPANSVEPPSDIITTTDSEYLMGIAKRNGTMIILLDLDKLLSEEEMSTVLDVAAAGSAEIEEEAATKVAPRAEQQLTTMRGEEDAAEEDSGGSVQEEPEMELTVEAESLEEKSPELDPPAPQETVIDSKTAATTKMDLSNPYTAEMLSGGIANAVSGLSQMVGKEVRLTSFSLMKIPIKDVPDLFGGPEALVVAVYLELSGYSQGHIILVYQPQTAFDLVDMLLGRPQGSTKTLPEYEQSVLGEVGNLMGSFFLNHLANSTGERFQPSPPAVMMDMAGAVLDIALGQVLAFSDNTYVVDTTFGTDDRQVAGTFLVVPIPVLPDGQRITERG